jgi:hypothetical protein
MLRRLSSIALIAAAIPGCFVLFPLDDYKEGAGPIIDGGLTDGVAPGDATNEATAPTTLSGRLVFITSTAFDGKLGGAAGGDDVCTRVAAAVGISGTFKAILAGDSAGATDRFPAENQAGKKGLVDIQDRPIADNEAKLFANGPTNLIEWTEKKTQLVTTGGEDVSKALLQACQSGTLPAGQTLPFPIVWSGANATGGKGESGDCQAWTADGEGQKGGVGLPGAKDFWLQASKCALPCNAKAHLYCVQQ